MRKVVKEAVRMEQRVARIWSKQQASFQVVPLNLCVPHAFRHACTEWHQGYLESKWQHRLLESALLVIRPFPLKEQGDDH
jgi:hypothetical protein